MFGQALAVGCGGFLGSIVRWGIGEVLGRAIPALPGGTLVANVVARTHKALLSDGDLRGTFDLLHVLERDVPTLQHGSRLDCRA